MKKIFYYLPVVTALLTLGSCDNETESLGEKSKTITVSTKISNMHRLSTDAKGNELFDEGDEISVYAWTGDKNKVPASAGLVINNSINRLNANGTWVSTPQMLWKNNIDDHYFIGVYPKRQVDNLTKDLFEFDLTNQTNNDLLAAVNVTGCSFKEDAGNDVPLLFSHLLSKVIVKLSFRNQWGTTPTVDSVIVASVKTQGYVNYLTKEITNPDHISSAPLKLPCESPNVKYASVVLPIKQATGDGDASLIEVYIAGKKYTYRNPSGSFVFAPGKYTTINLIVGRDKLELGEVAVSPWNEGLNFNGEASDEI